MADYLEKAFAENGDKDPIPVAVQVDGSVSYDSGFGYDYERDPDPLVDPLTKPVPRDKTNQLFNTITGILKQYQDDGGAPEWSPIRAAAGGYPFDARVIHGGLIWISLTAANTQTPGVGADWIQNAALDPTLRAMAALTPAANQMMYFTGADLAALATLTSFGRSMNAAADADAGIALLGILTGFSMTDNGIDFPNILGQIPANGGFKIRWGSRAVGGNGNTPVVGLFPNRCLGGCVTIGGSTGTDIDAPKFTISGANFTLYNGYTDAVTHRFIMVGD